MVWQAATRVMVSMPRTSTGRYITEKITCRIEKVNKRMRSNSCGRTRRKQPYLYNQEPTMTKEKKKLSKQERELQSLLKKMKKLPKKPMGARYQDPTTLRNDDDMEAAMELFQEMKRRDF
jgi:hypothetical protein